MTGAQLLEDIKKRGIDLGSREVVLQKLLEPFMDREVPPNLRNMIEEELSELSGKDAEVPDTKPSMTVSRSEFDSLSDRVEVLEKIMDGKIADRIGIDSPKRANPLAPPPFGLPAKPLMPPLPSIPHTLPPLPKPASPPRTEDPLRQQPSLPPRLTDLLPQQPASPLPTEDPLRQQPTLEPQSDDIFQRPLPQPALPPQSARPLPPVQPDTAPVPETAPSVPPATALDSEEVALKAAAAQKSQEDKQSVDQVLSELQSLKTVPPQQSQQAS